MGVGGRWVWEGGGGCRREKVGVGGRRVGIGGRRVGVGGRRVGVEGEE